MSKKVLINILLLFLLSSALFFTLRYISSLKENISSLEEQKQNLLQTLEKQKRVMLRVSLMNASLKSYIRAAHRRLTRSFSDLGIKDEGLERLKAQSSILRAEKSALLEEKKKILQENERLKMKLSSVEELKKALQEFNNVTQIQGNRGFLVKDGQPTSAVKVKIEVKPAPGNNNDGRIPTDSPK